MMAKKKNGLSGAAHLPIPMPRCRTLPAAPTPLTGTPPLPHPPPHNSECTAGSDRRRDSQGSNCPSPVRAA